MKYIVKDISMDDYISYDNSWLPRIFYDFLNQVRKFDSQSEANSFIKINTSKYQIKHSYKFIICSLQEVLDNHI